MKNIEVKNWNKYSQEEKECLLNHWWHYYGKMVYTFDELDQFNKLLKKSADKIFVVALTSYSCGKSSEYLIAAMRGKRIDSYLRLLPSLKSADSNVKAMEVQLINELVSTYNNPEPAIPMSDNEIMSQILNLKKNN